MPIPPEDAVLEVSDRAGCPAGLGGSVACRRWRRWLAALVLPAALLLWQPAAALAAAAGGGEHPPTRLRLVKPAGPLVPGQQTSLRIETLDDGGKPLPVQRQAKVTLSGIAGLTATTEVSIEPGASQVEVPITAGKPGLWQIDARTHGLYSASTVIVCVAPAVLQHHQAVAANAAKAVKAAQAGAAAEQATPPPHQPPQPHPPVVGEARPTAPARALPPPPSPPRAEREPAPSAATGAPRPQIEVRSFMASKPLARVTAPGALPPKAANARPAAGPATELIATTAPATAGAGASRAGSSGSSGAGGSGSGGTGGEVRLIPEHLERYRGTQGWDSVSIDAYWYENGNPSPAPRDLDVSLVANQGNLQIDPVRLSIPNGDFVSSHPAVVTATTAQSSSLQALYPGGQSNLVDISFLAAPPAKLAFVSGSQEIRAFGVASSEVYVRLLDAAGEPAVADGPIQVNVQLTGPIGSPLLAPASIAAGQIEARVPVSLPRFGTYTVAAAAAGLADAAPLTIQVAFDWGLLLAALFGGLLGSLTRVLYRGDAADRNPRRLLRVLVLGGLAALLVVLLSAFGLLSLIAGAMPQGFSDALAKVPLGSLTGDFLLGFLAGLLFDRVFGHLLSPPAGGAAAAPPAAPPLH